MSKKALGLWVETTAANNAQDLATGAGCWPERGPKAKEGEQDGSVSTLFNDVFGNKEILKLIYIELTRDNDV
jgi:hypothetical protein